MSLTRREVLWVTAAGAAGACAREGAVMEPTEISAVVEVPRADVERGQDATYEISGDGHTHLVPVDAAAMRRALGPELVTVVSGPVTNNRHRHLVRVRVV